MVSWRAGDGALGAYLLYRSVSLRINDQHWPKEVFLGGGNSSRRICSNLTTTRSSNQQTSLKPNRVKETEDSRSHSFDEPPVELKLRGA